MDDLERAQESRPGGGEQGRLNYLRSSPLVFQGQGTISTACNLRILHLNYFGTSPHTGH
ncbi:hypothetical protein ASPTUDRAFT_392444 [Aspergillus tubingensis CBS 134.48]|uniref:Uncharacterized protein n=1 Tax=Aspergillus tubingensis (strain CBS 134.48) TaxID=767770 RepID=A0A1L9NF94_ASPTC|nr:hypothetical protein ASPTUDRAFT_392444 [Aspergillus tubingensis CBS 134.48]